MEEIYKDWKIAYHEVGSFADKQFVAKKDVFEITGKTLKDIKIAIDKHAKKAFKRIPCFCKDYGKLVEAEITSIFKTNSDGTPKGVYINIKGGTHRKIEGYSLEKLYKHTEKNQQLFKEMQDLEESIAKLNGEVASKKEGLEVVDLGDLVQ